MSVALDHYFGSERMKRCARRGRAANIAPAMAEVSSENAGGERREAILTAAARVIARSGVRGLRVEEVASEAGVSPPLLYYHFASRQGPYCARRPSASDKAPSAGAVGRPAPARVRRSRPPYWRSSTRSTVQDNAIVWGEVSATAVFEPELRADVKRVTDTWSATVPLTRSAAGSVTDPSGVDGPGPGGRDADYARRRPLGTTAGGRHGCARRGSCWSQPPRHLRVVLKLVGSVPTGGPSALHRLRRTYHVRGTRLWLVIGMIAALFATALVAGCGDDDDDDATTRRRPALPATSKRLRKGSHGGYRCALPAIPDRDPGGRRLQGCEIELFNAIAEKLGYPDPEYSNTNFASVFRDTANGLFDIAVVSSTILTERERVVDFTDLHS